ncbi:MAG: hypothetical protein OEQ39_03040 [Gammaproteobacteria bacterium]|nr:hypothetical protein [Gammaproteobacteria bacterium]MDH3375926.1 hypothetical protein [Gammaproteobacteria bacterium]
MADFAVTTSFADGLTGLTKSQSDTFTLTGNDFDHKLVTVTTGEYTWTLPTGIGSAGYMFIKNHDTTGSALNYVDVGVATTVYFCRLYPGQSGIFPVAPTTSAIYLKAGTASVFVEAFIREA